MAHEPPLRLDERHAYFRKIAAETGSTITAFCEVRTRFGLDFRQAKEVMVQAQGWAASLEEHEDRLAEELERALFLDAAAKELGLDSATREAMAGELYCRLDQGVSWDDAVMELWRKLRPSSETSP